MQLLADIEDVARREAGRPCVVAAGGAVTSYGTVLDRARRAAAALAAHGGGRRAPVLLSATGLLDRVVVELGCLLAGVPFAPLRPEAPPAYARRVATALSPALTVGDGACLAALGPRPVGALVAGGGQGPGTQLPDPGPEACAYVMFTSGSSGRPKGVRVPRRALDAYCTSFGAVAEVVPSDVSLVLGAADFDVSIEEVFPFLQAGARLAEAPAGTGASPAALAGQVAATGATTVFVPPLVLEALFAHDWRGTTLRLLRTGGERVLAYPPPDLGVTVLNEYGPTETTVAVTCCDLTRWGARDEPPPIGRPLPHVRARVDDPDTDGRGELVVSGPGVALGYLHPEPAGGFADGEEGPEYRTGDVVSLGADGAYRFHGRRDRQVQVAGVRLELDALEHAARQHPGVEAAAAAALTDGAGRTGAVVVAYVGASPAPGEAALLEAIRGAAATPDLPVRLHRTDRLPLDERGKVDRARVLADAADASETAEAGAEPAPAGLEDVCRLFSDLLDQPVEASSSLFAAGLTSRTAEEAARLLQARTGTGCTAREVFLHPTPARLHARLAGHHGADPHGPEGA